MQKSRRFTRTFLVDTNVLVAAIKHPERQTDTLRLLLKIIRDPRIHLVGNVLLAHEMRRYVERFESRKVALLLSALLSEMELVKVQPRFVRACKTHVSTPNKADILHAATCLQTGAVLITNDLHFNRIKKEKIIKVLSISEAIRELL